MLCGWGGNCRPGGKQWQPNAGWMTYGHLQADCLHTGISSGPNALCRVWEAFTFASCFLQRAEMRMVRWMCNVKIKHRVPSKELTERLGIDDIILILQQNRLRWYGHVLRKEDTDWGRNVRNMRWRAPDQEVD